ncbi:DUF6266 family protein [Sphingobacterium sp. UBA2074]|uniref:DUF6266 family protein n=1 Tax=Sphingobacterium sp. UBA2074 TaxID=1947487 RepID=UPI00257F3344|nr:DUF6266 family protein [Sphingobacterium sp. UBA2074]
MKLLSKQKEIKVLIVNGTETVRMKFARARKFINPVNDIIQMGYTARKRNVRKTSIGRAMSALLRNAMKGIYPDIEVDPTKAQLSVGVKLPLGVDSVDRQQKQITIVWNSATNVLYQDRPDDGIILCAYAVEEELAAINDELAVRQDGTLIMQLPDGMEKLPIHLYLIVHDREKANFSNSQYLGLFI